MRERCFTFLVFIHFFRDTNVVFLLINLVIVRRIHARMSDPQQFSELENHCHNFVRRGQALRSASGSPSAGYGAKTSS